MKTLPIPLIALALSNALGDWVGSEVISAVPGRPAIPVAAALQALAPLLFTFISLPRGRLQRATQRP